jgi:Chaperone of endosialidase
MRRLLVAGLLVLMAGTTATHGSAQAGGIRVTGQHRESHKLHDGKPAAAKQKNGGANVNAIASDITLKADIVPLARLDNGLELYRFRYKGSDCTSYVGVMAQEVQAIEPSAVSRDRDGYLVVNYDRLGLEFMTWDQWLARTNVNYRLAH